MGSFEILIVEDHPMMIRSITASLEVLYPQAHTGCSVMIVGSLMQAKKRLQQREPPHLIIADLHLPDSRGLLTLRALRGAEHAHCRFQRQRWPVHRAGRAPSGGAGFHLQVGAASALWGKAAAILARFDAGR